MFDPHMSVKDSIFNSAEML